MDELCLIYDEFVEAWNTAFPDDPKKLNDMVNPGRAIYAVKCHFGSLEAVLAVLTMGQIADGEIDLGTSTREG